MSAFMSGGRPLLECSPPLGPGNSAVSSPQTRSLYTAYLPVYVYVPVHVPAGGSLLPESAPPQTLGPEAEQRPGL